MAKQFNIFNAKKPFQLTKKGTVLLEEIKSSLSPVIEKYMFKMGGTPVAEMELVFNQYMTSLTTDLILAGPNASARKLNTIKAKYSKKPKTLNGIVHMINNGNITSLGQLAITELNETMFVTIQSAIALNLEPSQIIRLNSMTLNNMCIELRKETGQTDFLSELIIEQKAA